MTKLKQLWANRRNRWLLVAAVVVLYLVWSGQRASVPPVQVSTSFEGPLRLTIAASGRVDGESADLGFGSSGTVAQLYVGEGAQVGAGEPLARLRRDAGGMMGSISAEDESIDAPWPGRVVQIYRQEGSAVQPSMPVLRVVRDGRPELVAFLDAEDAGWLRPGVALTARAGGYLARPWDVRVESVGGEAVAREDVPGSSRQVRVLLSVESPGFNLPVGAAVDIDGEVPMVDQALLVPAGAVTKSGAHSTVWRVDDDNILHRVEVRTGPTNLRYVSILAGLEAGQRVVVETGAGGQLMGPAIELEAGQRVRPTVWEGEAYLRDELGAGEEPS